MDWPRFVEIVQAHRRFLLTTHIRPDCDALGSTLAMGAILESLGKDVSIVVGYDVPANLRWIDRGGKILRLGKDISDEEVDAVDVLMVLDTSAWAQLSHLEDVIRRTKAQKIVLDHHVNGDELGAEEFRDRGAEATGRLVVEAADALGVELTAEMAARLFAAISTDTGWFRFPSAGSDCYRLAGRLIDAGASPPAIYAELYENETLARLRLIGRTMARAETDLDSRLIYTWITRDDFDATGAAPTDSEDVVNMTYSVSGTEGAVILVEQPEGGFKVSFRSRCKMDCSEVASQFGGGGHKAAAGAMVHEPLETARSRVLDAVRQAMR
ncbi:MAG: DHH family phosphoesterase [Pirellulales bacterium]|nr:DHH family phosphoesterase [Pirellulales bacterium]